MRKGRREVRDEENKEIGTLAASPFNSFSRLD